VGLLFSPQCAEWIMIEVLIEGFYFFSPSQQEKMLWKMDYAGLKGS
jgi:hypothetical protein